MLSEYIKYSRDTETIAGGIIQKIDMVCQVDETKPVIRLVRSKIELITGCSTFEATAMAIQAYLYFVKCYRGGRKIHPTLSISEILSQA